MSKPTNSPVPPTDFSGSVVREDAIEYGFIGTLQKLKYEYRPDISDVATLEAGDCIWHIAGSGKMLTSFKAATLLKGSEHIHKCVFVLDRKDPDRQTREEFHRFQEGCIEENTNTAAPSAVFYPRTTRTRCSPPQQNRKIGDETTFSH